MNLAKWGLGLAMLLLLANCSSDSTETADAGSDTGISSDGASDSADGATQETFQTAKFFIELTEDDIEVQSFIDGTSAGGWTEAQIRGPNDAMLFSAVSTGRVGSQGLSELKVDGWPSHFPIENNPEHTEIANVSVFLEQFPAGTYRFSGKTLSGVPLVASASFTHNLPALPEITSPTQGEAAPVVAEDVVIEWKPVTSQYESEASVDIVGYEVIVEQVEPFRRINAILPANATRFEVPNEFLSPDAFYDFEIVAIETSDNQSISVGEFRTSATARVPDELATPADQLKVTTFFIELTVDDIEIQTFVDGARWTDLTVRDQSGAEVLSIGSSSYMGTQGLSELKIDGWPSHFPVENNPEHTEIARADIFLAQFPAGTYQFRATRATGGTLTGSADFTHALPSLPEIVKPTPDLDDPEELPVSGLTVEWKSVTTDYFSGEALDVVEWEIIVAQEDPPRDMHIHLPASATRVTVPSAFLLPGKLYEVEVIAIERSNNQSISVAEFTTSS